MYFYRLFLVLFILGSCVEGYAQEGIRVEEVPEWVDAITVSAPGDIPVDQVQGGIHYLLVDSQVKVSPSDVPIFYHHNAEYVVNYTGVEQNSQINIDYDPSYQNLVLHSLNVIRNGESIDKINSAQINFLQREDEMDDLIYNGRTTLNIIIGDVRVGDIIDYSYSREGMNPVYGNKFSFSQYLSWTVPVGSFSTRILWGKDRRLYSKVENSTLSVSQVNTTEDIEYKVVGKNISPVTKEEGAPARFSPWGSVTFSEFKSWEDVVAWGLKLYSYSDRGDAELDDLVDGIKSKYSNKKDQISEALRFVQDEIRYLGIEMAENSHVPTPPSETLRNRYGDCKDKTFLLLALLKRLGVEAYPALVNTDTELKNTLPNAQAFDHVITYLILDKEAYWLDPTRTFQMGGIDNIYQPDYGSALLIRKGEKFLINMEPALDRSGIYVHDVFEISPNDYVSFTSTTKKLGWNAEVSRQYLARSGTDMLQREYLDFFQAYYPGLVLEGPMEVENSSSGEMITRESYRINDFWEDDLENHRYVVSFYANIVSSSLSIPNSRTRSQPYYFYSPMIIEQTIEVFLGEDGWQFDDEKHEEDNKYFKFLSNVKFSEEDQKLILKYFFEPKSEVIDASDFSEFVSKLEDLDGRLSYGLYRNNDSIYQEPEEEGFLYKYADLAVPFIIGFYLLLYFLVLILWRLDKNLNPLNDNGDFYPVSAVKLIGMWILTFGLYGAYWFYKNFQFIKETKGNSSMPFFRGVFHYFWIFPLWRYLKDDNDDRYQEKHLPGKLFAVLSAIVYLVIGLLSNSSILWVPLMILSALMVLPLANYIQYVNGVDSEAYIKNSSWRFRHILLAILSVPLLTLTYGGDVGLLPDDTVIKGEELWEEDIRFMERWGVIQPGDEVRYFYSDGFLLKSDDGNGFTDRHVFSYWKEEGEVYFFTAEYQDIEDIEVTWASNELENTVIKIVHNDGGSFVLYASAVDGKDKIFVNNLKAIWGGRGAP